MRKIAYAPERKPAPKNAGMLLRKARDDRGVPLSEMARMLGVGKAYVSCVECGRVPVTGSMVRGYAVELAMLEDEVDAICFAAHLVPDDIEAMLLHDKSAMAKARLALQRGA